MFAFVWTQILLLFSVCLQGNGTLAELPARPVAG